MKSRNDAGSSWTYSALYKRGSKTGIWQETSSPGLTGEMIVGAEGDSGVINDGNGVNHFKGKADGFSFMPRCYANTTASAANVYVSSSGNLQRSTSSRRWKENERPCNVGDEGVLSLTPVLFDYKDQLMPDGEIRAGEKNCISYIAEDSGVFASLDENGVPEGINWNLITMHLLEKIKVLDKKLTDLQNTQPKGTA
jgi:hypothetical protein